MPFIAVLPLLATAALLPAAMAAFRPAPGRRDALFWWTLAVAAAGPVAMAVLLGGHGWRTGFAYALWVSIAATAVAFAGLAAWSRAGARLAPLMLPYLLVLASLALFWGQAPEQPLRGGPSGWLWAHIVVAVATYALIGIAGVAALAVVLQETAVRWIGRLSEKTSMRSTSAQMRSVSSQIRRVSSRSASPAFCSSSWAAPRMPDSGFFTSCASIAAMALTERAAPRWVSWWSMRSTIARRPRWRRARHPEASPR